MKKILSITIIVGVILGIFYFLNKKEAVAPVMDVPYSDLIERTNVENYLNDNISELSPVKAVLGGTWYVVAVTIDMTKNIGTVIYEDGHIQEKRNFSYVTNEKREVVNLKLN